MPQPTHDLVEVAANAEGVADLLKALANARRLLILCTLAERGEAKVGELSAAVGLSASAVSQHLSRMREEGLVTARRDRQMIWYRIADRRTAALLAHLQRNFCQPSRGKQAG
jgi:ArsR family transcriptional regulator, virulence genes transcriptional regulator